MEVCAHPCTPLKYLCRHGCELTPSPSLALVRAQPSLEVYAHPCTLPMYLSKHGCEHTPSPSLALVRAQPSLEVCAHPHSLKVPQVSTQQKEQQNQAIMIISPHECGEVAERPTASSRGLAAPSQLCVLLPAPSPKGSRHRLRDPQLPPGGLRPPVSCASFCQLPRPRGQDTG